MKRIAENIFVSAQIQPEEIPAVQAAGIKQIICNRPDGEGADQPNFAEITAAAGDIRTVYVPVAGEFPPQAVSAVAEALASGVPTLMYCRSGMRSSVLWALTQAQQGRDVQEIVQAAADIGYDLSPMIGLLQAQA